MKKINANLLLLIVLIMFSACNEKTINKTREKSENNIEAEENEGGVSPVTLTSQQVQALSIKADTLPKYVFKNLVAANGYLNVPPQNKASVTTVLGANISSINVFEGDEVSKGQVLAYLTHPGLIDVQTEYINAQNRLEFMEQEYKRQEKLYSEQISSGKTYQKTLADYYNLKGTVLNLEAKLKLLHLDPLKIKKGSIYEKAPVLSPINGFVEKVNIRTGQFAEPQKTLFEIVDNRKIHADLMVFEKDIYKVKTGQKVVFEVESVPMSPMTATIFAVGKSFEQNPKAVHIHAKIDNKQGVLIPGMYITARIATGNKLVNALPEEAVVNEGGKSYIFTVEEKEGQWVFTPVEIIRGNNEEGWSEIRLLSPKGPNTKFAWNGAYYLLSEMKKDETGDDD